MDYFITVYQHPFRVFYLRMALSHGAVMARISEKTYWISDPVTMAKTGIDFEKGFFF